MKKASIITIGFLLFFFTLLTMKSQVYAERKEDPFTHQAYQEAKDIFDDPRPFMKEGSVALKNVFEPDVYATLTSDVETMKKLWAEVVGFKAPDIVGKIAPEIKPGKYSLQDKAQYTGLKDLLLPPLDELFSPAGPPHVAHFTEMEILPARQHYWYPRLSKATKENIGKTQLDEQGYIIEDTYVSGFPFPRPSGEFKAQQVIYNWSNRYSYADNMLGYVWPIGFNKDLKIDSLGRGKMYQLRCKGRLFCEPYGWLDERAQERGEMRGYLFAYLAPRDLAGSAFSGLRYLDPDKADVNMIYISGLRRIRRMSGTDTQDNVGGQDVIYDDNEGFDPKISPNRYPYTYKLIAEREYLVAFTNDGSTYLDSTNQYEWRNVQLERRPVYVLELIQQDPSYIYSKRTLCFDKETFYFLNADNYDYKGRLYRRGITAPHSELEMGLETVGDGVLWDKIDLHSTYNRMYLVPWPYLERNDINILGMVKSGK